MLQKNWAVSAVRHVRSGWCSANPIASPWALEPSRFLTVWWVKSYIMIFFQPVTWLMICSAGGVCGLRVEAGGWRPCLEEFDPDLALRDEPPPPSGGGGVSEARDPSRLSFSFSLVRLCLLRAFSTSASVACALSRVLADAVGEFGEGELEILAELRFGAEFRDIWSSSLELDFEMWPTVKQKIKHNN